MSDCPLINVSCLLGGGLSNGLFCHSPQCRVKVKLNRKRPLALDIFSFSVLGKLCG